MYRHNFENNCIYKYIVKTQIPIISFVLFRDSNLSKKCLPLTKLLYHFFMPKNCIQVCKELYPFLINFPSIPFSLCIHGKESTFSFVIPMSTQIYYFSRMHSMKCKKNDIDVYITMGSKQKERYILSEKRKKEKFFYDSLNLEYDYAYNKKFKKKIFP